MVEEDKKPEDEEKKEEVETPEEKPEDSKDSGDKPESTPLIDKANASAERLEKATAEQKKENDRTEKLAADKAFGGSSEGGQQIEKPKKLSDTEYAEALERGEVNPLKEDGVI